MEAVIVNKSPYCELETFELFRLSLEDDEASVKELDRRALAAGFEDLLDFVVFLERDAGGTSPSP